eukprot:gene22793-27527_t
MDIVQGGALSVLQGRRVMLISSNLTGNSASPTSEVQLSTGGAVYLHGSSTLEAIETVFDKNRAFHGNIAMIGGMAYLVDDSTMSIADTVISENTATVDDDEIGAMVAAEYTFVKVLRSQYGMAGAVLVADRARLTGQRLNISRNTAGSHGGFVACKNDQALHCLSLNASRFVQNTAGIGGGSVAWHSINGLAELNRSTVLGSGNFFAGNAAIVNLAPEGYATAWQRYEVRAAPELPRWRSLVCEAYSLACEAEPSAGAQQGEARRMPSGALMLGVNLVFLDQFGSPIHFSKTLDPPLFVELRVSGGLGNPSLLGQTSARYADGAASFTQTALWGAAGSTYDLTLSTQSISHTFQQTLLPCVVGQTTNVANADDQWYTCSTCEAGSIRFDNATSQCTGYFLAPNAKYCGESVQCFVDRIYVCPTAGACTTDEASREAVGAEAAEFLELCNKESYNGGLLCGGGLFPRCATGSYVSLGTCVDCPHKAVLFTTSLLLLGLLLAFLALVALMSLLLKDGSGVVMTTEVNTMDALEAVDEINEARGLVGLFLGYMQVITQLPLVFDPELVPQVMRDYTVNLGYGININLNFAFNVDCLSYHLGLYTPEAYWFNFVQAALTPGMILLLAGAFYVLMLWRTPKAKRDTSKYELQQAAVSLATFFLIFVHPSVATQMFQLFNCQKFHYTETSTDFPCSSQGCSYLFLDRTVQCYTPTWIGAVTVAVIVIIVYVF